MKKNTLRKKINRVIAALLAVITMLMFAVMPGSVQKISQKSELLQTMTDVMCAAITVEAAASDFTVEDVLAWLRSNEGKALDPDGAFGPQCVDAIDALMAFLGINWRNYLVEGAKDFAWRSIPDGWARYQGVHPLPGDILIYTGSGYGHVAIYESDYCTWHQNFNGHGYLEKVTSQRYDAWGYWGVLRPNYKVPEPPKPTEKQGSAMAKSSGQTTPDGIYWVHSSLSQIARLDLTGADNSAVASPSPAQMWSEKPLPGYDAVSIKYNENGWYTISPVDSNLCLDVNGASLSEKTKVQFHTANGTAAQDWSIEPTDTGFILRARCNGFVLTVADSACPNGTGLMTCEESGSKTQRWCFIPAQSDAGNLPENADCFLRSAGGKCGLTADENDAVCATETPSRWIIRSEDDGSVTVTEKHTGLVLGIDISADDNDYIRSKGVCLAESTGARSQHWIPMHTKYGTALVSQLNGFCLTMTDDGSISTAFRSGSEAQSWNIESAKAPKTLAGDLNCDGAVTIADAIMMARIVAESPVTVSETGLSNADVDCNDMLDASDTVLILKIIAKVPIEVWTVDDGSFSKDQILDEYWEYDRVTEKTSTQSKLTGWELVKEEWVKTGSGKYRYANFPEGFNTDCELYQSLGKHAGSDSETAITKRVYGSASAAQYIYWHWSYPLASACSEDDRYIGAYYGECTPAGTTTIWEAFTSSENVAPSDGSGSACKITGHSNGYSYWWFQLQVMSQDYADYEKQYRFRQTEHVRSEKRPGSTENTENLKHYILVAE